jgi:tetratricopeptide (TPR) repeat protein
MTDGARPFGESALTPEARHAAAVHYERGDQLLAARRPDLAISHFRACCAIDPANIAYRRARRLAQRDLCRRTARRGLFARLRQRLSLARLHKLVQREHWEHVLLVAEDVLDRNVQCQPAHEALAQAFEMLGLLDQAIWVLEQATLFCDEVQSLREALSRLYERRGSFTQAREMAKPLPALDDRAIAREQQLETAIADNPTDKTPYLELTQLYRQSGRGLRARQILTKGLAPTRNDFEIAIALLDLDLDIFRQDLAAVDAKLAGQPDNHEMLALRQRLQTEVLAREVELWRQRADRYPAEPSHRVELGVRLLKAGRFEEALETFLALRRDPIWGGRCLLYASYCHLNYSQWRKAEPLLREALTVLRTGDSSSRKEVLFLLAQNAADTGRWGEALTLGRELANADSNYRQIEDLVSQWQKRRDDEAG